MLTIYFLKPYDSMDNGVEYNDGWFNMHIGKFNMDDADSSIIKSIDGVDVYPEDKKYFISPFKDKAIVKMDNLSTGCKTALNVLNFPDKCFSINECGRNAIDKIFTFDDGKVFINRYPGIFKGAKFPFKMVWDNKEYIANDYKEALGIAYSNMGRVY